MKGPSLDPKKYWEERYSTGGNSGKGSYGALAEFKAATINRFVANHEVHSVIEFGSGDGNQLGLAEYPQYLGFDVSETAVRRCRDLFKADGSKSFRLMHEYWGGEGGTCSVARCYLPPG